MGFKDYAHRPRLARYIARAIAQTDQMDLVGYFCWKHQRRKDIMFEFIIHYKDGTDFRQVFDTHEEYWEHLTDFAMTQEATPDISIRYAEWGPVVQF